MIASPLAHFAHFGLREAPFGITPDPSFFYATDATRAALATLTVALSNGEGFIKVTGEVGTGKTLLCRMLLDVLDAHDWASAYIHNPDLEPRTLLLAIGEELRISIDPAMAQHQMLRALNHGLLDIARANRRVVLCLDETQAMPLATLEALRLLTNLETEKRKLIQVVLFGQPELDERLNDHRIRQLKQRITFQHVLGGFSREETMRYLQHRMEVAGHPGGQVFSKLAARAIHAASHGTPRLINILATKAVLLAYGRGSATVDWRDARSAVADTPASSAMAARWAWLSFG